MLALRAVIDAKPDMFNHNVETIPRLYKCVRSQAIARAFVWVPFARSREGLSVVSLPVKRRMRSGRIDSKERLFRPAFQCVFC
jgi:hypothetical protein